MSGEQGPPDPAAPHQTGPQEGLQEGRGGDGANDSEQEEGIITSFPDELMLLIFKHLGGRDLVSSVSKVSRKWEQLACEPVLWRNKFIYYNSQRIDDFIQHLCYACDQIKQLHLGGHVALDERALQAILSLQTEVIIVKRLDFFGSCRTDPAVVIDVLKKFTVSTESLSLCLNDELVSYGKDGKTCYARPLLTRPGLLITLLGNMKNLRYLKLCGGFKTQWYFSELLEEGCLGCNNIETLDLKDFEEVSDNFRSFRKFDFVESLILKNKDHLKCLKLSDTSKFNVRNWVRNCQDTLKELSINLKHIDCLYNSLFRLTCLELSGKSQLDWSSEINSLSQYCHVTQDLEEVNLIYLQEHDFSSIAQLLNCVQVLRIEGNVLSKENIEAILNYLPSIVKLCVREMNAVSKKHMISMELSLSALKEFDIELIDALDCLSSKIKLQHIPISKLETFSTGCQCRKGTYEPNNNIPQLGVPDSFQTACGNELANDGKLISFTISNGLQQEFLPEFWGLHENDVIFHFCQ